MRFIVLAVFLALTGLTGAFPAAAQSSRVQAVPQGYYVPPGDAIPAWVWAGGSFTNGFEGAWAGGIAAVNGNLSSNTMLFRAEGLIGTYDYDLIAPGTSNNFEVDMHNSGVYGGMRFSTGKGWLSGYIGWWGEDHNNNRDPNAKLQGTEAGPKGIVDLWQPLGPKLALVAYGAYAEAWETGNAYGRLSYQLTERIKIGPEISWFKNVAYEDGKFGGYLGYSPEFLGYGEIAVTGGYRHPVTDSPDGYYVNAFVSFPIR